MREAWVQNSGCSQSLNPTREARDREVPREVRGWRRKEDYLKFDVAFVANLE